MLSFAVMLRIEMLWQCEFWIAQCGNIQKKIKRHNQSLQPTAKGGG